MGGFLGFGGLAEAKPPAGVRWVANPVLSDEFNGTVLNPRKWRPKHAWWVGRTPSIFVEKNVKVGGGALQIWTTVLAKPIGKNTIGTGCVSSLQPIAGPGYYEARIKAAPLPVASIFFFQRRDGQEIDIAENFGASIHNPFFRWQNRSATHWFPNGYKRKNDTGSYVKIATPNTDWHVYGLWWKSPSEAWIYVDDELVSKHRMKGPFTKPMFMFFDSEVTLQGMPTQSEAMRVDWVRAYKAG